MCTVLHTLQAVSSTVASTAAAGAPPAQAALRAKDAGSTRFCMGAAWRGPSQVGPRQWDRVLSMVSRIRGLGMEVCTTLGMLTPEQAQQLRTAGLTCYNHNLDTSPEYYGKITTTRKFEVSAKHQQRFIMTLQNEAHAERVGKRVASHTPAKPRV